MVVEITPIGIDSIGWRFYIIWTVFNFSFIPIVYFFYPETAGRSLEDIDRFFMANQSIFIHTDPDAKSEKRPERYVAQQREEERRLSSAHTTKPTAALSGDAAKDEENGLAQGFSHVERSSR